MATHVHVITIVLSIACDCNIDGVTDDGDCERNGTQPGQCACKTYVEGRTCDTCMVGYYNLLDSNQDGCQGSKLCIGSGIFVLCSITWNYTIQQFTKLYDFIGCYVHPYVIVEYEILCTCRNFTS